MPENEQHIYHHNDINAPRINVSAERNSKGWNYSATIIGAETPAEAMKLLRDTVAKLEAEFGVQA